MLKDGMFRPCRACGLAKPLRASFFPRTSVPLMKGESRPRPHSTRPPLFLISPEAMRTT